MVCDISRAFFYAPVYHEIYVELCEEAITREEDRKKCGRLLKSMYGTKAAAQNWQSFTVGRSSPVLFWNRGRVRISLCFA